MDDRQFIQEMRAAIRGGDCDAVMRLVKLSPERLQMTTTLGSWLHTAARSGQLPVVQCLVGLGMDVDTTGGPAGGGAMNDAAGQGHAQIVSYLLSQGAKLDTSEPERNPLFAAIQNGHMDVVRLLVDAGIDTTVRYSGESMKDMEAVAFAVEWGRTEIAEFLKGLRGLGPHSSS